MKLGKMGVAVVTLAMALAACGGGDDGGTTGGTAGGTGAPTGGAGGGDAGALTIWVDGLRAPAVKQAADAFGAENGITVNTEIVAKDLQTNFVTASQAGKGPDLVLGAHDWIGNLVQNGTIDPLQLTEDVKGQFEEIALRGVTFNNQVYGVPFAIGNVGLIRNTDLAPQAPKTIEELVAMGKKLKAEGKVTEILAIPVGPNGDPYHINPLYTSGGGYMFGSDGQGNYDKADLGVAKPEAAKAYEKIRALGEKGEGALKRSITIDNVLSLFTGKKAAFMISGPWQTAGIRQAGVKYDITPVPPFEGGETAKPFVTVDAIYVASKGKNKTLAQEFATNYFTRTDVAVSLYKADPRPPALTAALQELEASDPDLAKWLAAGEVGEIMPAIPEMAAIWDPLGKAEAAVIGGADPASTIAAAAKAIQGQIS